MADDLFTPTIIPTAYVDERRPPWRPGSLVYPAIFGGVLAGTTLALINASRLRLPTRATLAIAGTGLVALVARVLVTVTLLDGRVSGTGRLVGALCGALVGTVAHLAQRSRFRTWEMRGGEPASLVKAGIAAALGLGILEGLIIVLVGAR
ncbi:hypothetical protein Q2K19_06045 [Micromonospora soli]|uniref:hypothetical protein n=1 Tax=Micromonospora sp. NBRC 110009 TaxID=3061627 RepID=UPI0026714B05|nr:hypothetical protein [Micromonospora sp. NBRC 110009]WKU00048.1 hypothetical protein Q2K19_06045 [Micromonospora sp. NBRC 110009]